MNNRSAGHYAPGGTAVRKRPNKRRAVLICTILAAVFVIAMAVVLMSVSDNRSYNDYMNQAQLLFYNKDYDGALAALRKAAAVEKTDECLMLMADCYQTQGNYAKTLEMLRMMDTNKPSVASRIAEVETLRRNQGAIETVTIAGKESPVNTTRLVLDNMQLGDAVLYEVTQLYAIDSLSMADSHPIRRNVSGEDLLDLMRSRRSCRHFRPDPVPEEVLQTLLEAARACPTAKNLQATRYIAVTDAIPALLDSALEALGKVGEVQIKTATAPDERRRAENFLRWRETRRNEKTFDPLFFHAPLLLLFVSEQETARDAAGAAAYTELMAASLGLGCLYSGYFTACAAGSREIHEMLGLKDSEQVVRCLVLGWPDIRFRRTAPRKTPDLTRI